MKIIIELCSTRSVKIEMNKNDLIGMLKRKLAETKVIHVEDCSFQFEGKVLNDNKTFEEYGINDNSIFSLVPLELELQDATDDNSFICENKNCIYFDQHHFGNCRNKCQNVNCIYFDHHHCGNCRNKCQNMNCIYLDQHHCGNCQTKSEIESCFNGCCLFFNQIHEGCCCFICKNMNCLYENQYHEGGCVLK
jgi:hypothetical protein